MLNVKRLIVSAIERACDMTHFVTHHRPWLWAFAHCPLARLSYNLDERWGTGRWGPSADQAGDES